MHPRRPGHASTRPRHRAVAILLGLTFSALIAAPASGSINRSPSEADRSVTPGLAASQLRLQFITAGLASPTGVTSAGDGSGRLFVTEREGRIRVVLNGDIQPGYFLDFADEVQGGGEEGLLGLAFDPNFATNHLLYVYFTEEPSGAGNPAHVPCRLPPA